MRMVQRLAVATPPAVLDRMLEEHAPEQLHAFVRLSWRLVCPSERFIDGVYVHAACEFLEAVTRGEIKRGIMNVPPGFMKSLLTGVFWPAWEWIRHPEMTYLYGSYDPQLSLRDARRCYELVSSRWFSERWGRILPSHRQAAGDYYTRVKGNRFSTSVKGKATGRHFKRHIADDPIKPKDALGGQTVTEAALDEVTQWWDQTIATRTANYSEVVRLVVMQRLHERDLSGYLIDKGGYEHFCYPMRYDTMIQCRWDKRQSEGDLAWPERFPEKDVQLAEEGLGSAAAIASQLQQRPNPKGGLIFKQTDFRFWSNTPRFDPNGRPCLARPLTRAGIWFQSWDMTFKDSDGTDYVAGGLWQGVDNMLYLHDCVNERLEFTKTCDAMRSMTGSQPRAHRKLVENKANGPAVESQLRKDIPGIILVEPDGGKVARANASSTYTEKKCVVLPHPSEAPWVKTFLKQACNFPRAKHDDMVDMMTQAILDYFQRRNKLQQAMKNLGKAL